MADIDEVLERLVTDPHFRAEFAADQTAALAGYELSQADAEMLAAALDASHADLPHAVELRTSKSALVGLLAAFAPGGGEPVAGASEATGRGSGAMPPPAVAGLEAPVPADSAAPLTETVSFNFAKLPGGADEEAPPILLKEPVKNSLDSMSEGADDMAPPNRAAGGAPSGGHAPTEAAGLRTGAGGSDESLVAASPESPSAVPTSDADTVKQAAVTEELVIDQTSDTLIGSNTLDTAAPADDRDDFLTIDET